MKSFARYVVLLTAILAASLNPEVGAFSPNHGAFGNAFFRVSRNWQTASRTHLAMSNSFFDNLRNFWEGNESDNDNSQDSDEDLPAGTSRIATIPGMCEQGTTENICSLVP